jgi:hypothetical protein
MNDFYHIRCLIGFFLIITAVEFSYGIISDDICNSPQLTVDISFWFIIKACVTFNLLTLLYCYTILNDEQVCNRQSLYTSIWVLSSVHCFWLIIGAQMFWRPCDNTTAPWLLWSSVLIGVLTFIAVVKMLSLIDIILLRNHLTSNFNIT